MNEAQRLAAMNAARQAMDEIAAPLIASASVFTRGAYQAFFDQHREEMCEKMAEAIGEAVAAQSTGSAPAQ